MKLIADRNLLRSPLTFYERMTRKPELNFPIAD